MRPQHRIRIVDLDVGDDDTDQRSDARKKADQIENVDNERERRIGYVALAQERKISSMRLMGEGAR